MRKTKDAFLSRGFGRWIYPALLTPVLLAGIGIALITGNFGPASQELIAASPGTHAKRKKTVGVLPGPSRETISSMGGRARKHFQISP